MKSVKSFAVILMALLVLTVNVIASDVLVPNEVIMGTLDDYKTIEKVYVLPGDSDENIIPKEGFTESDVEYVFEEMKVVDNSEEDTKDYVENINYHTSTNDAEAVITLFSPTIEVSTEDGYIAKMSIPDIDLSVKVYEGTTNSVLSKGVGHFKETSIWDGNVCLASHNRGTGAYFSDIHELDLGAAIKLTTKLGTRKYEVYSIEKISVDDTSDLQNTSDNIITLITCVKNQSDYYRWCVKAEAV